MAGQEATPIFFVECPYVVYWPYRLKVQISADNKGLFAVLKHLISPTYPSFFSPQKTCDIKNIYNLFGKYHFSGMAKRFWPNISLF
jgi:hypothetical protein